MKVLITHPIHPGQFGLLATALSQEGDEVVFLAHAGGREDTPYLIEKYSLPSSASPEAHPHIIAIEQSILHAEGALVQARALRDRGFSPDLIIGHAGLGQLVFMREMFPATKIIAYAEYFYRAFGADVGFDPALAISFDDFPRVRLKNAATLLSLDAADAAYTPTEWQRNLFPAAYHSLIDVIHDGIDTSQFGERRKVRHITLPTGEIIKAGAPLITFAARALEHYRGFHQFWPALAEVLKVEEGVRALVVGGQSPAYGPDGPQSLLEQMLREHHVDRDRVIFAESLSRPSYQDMLSISACHVYLSYPFVPSWSLIEAMASGAPLVVSDVKPVCEVVGEGTCEKVDFFDTKALTQGILKTLRKKKHAIRQAKRAADRAAAEFDFQRKSWPRLRRMIDETAKRKR